MESKEDMPKIHYLTALDIYMITCFLFVLSAIVEFAFVHYHSKSIFEQDLLLLYRLISLNKRLLAKSTIRSAASVRLLSTRKNRRRGTGQKLVRITELDESSEIEDDESVGELQRLETSLAPRPKNACLNWSLVWKSLRRKSCNNLTSTQEKEEKPVMDESNRPVSFLKGIIDIDYYAKIIFPSLFLAFNIAYWTYYLRKRDNNQVFF